MTRRILTCLAVLFTASTALPANGATTGTGLFTGHLQMGGGVWGGSTVACLGAGIDTTGGGPAICSFTAYGAMTGSCTLWTGSVSGTFEFVHSTPRVHFVGAATGVSLFGSDLKIVIDATATNPWTGDNGVLTATIIGVVDPFGGPCQAYVTEGTVTATLPA